MLSILLALFGGFLGYRTAAKRDGDNMDKLQYTAVYFLAFAIIGLFIGVLYDRFF